MFHAIVPRFSGSATSRIKLDTSATVLADPVVEISYVGVNGWYVRGAPNGTPRGDTNLNVASVTIWTNSWSATVSLT